MNNYCLYSAGPMVGNFERTVRVVHEELPHFHTHPELQLFEHSASKAKLFYLCLLANTSDFRPPPECPH
jgi:hypothetical protein